MKRVLWAFAAVLLAAASARPAFAGRAMLQCVVEAISIANGQSSSAEAVAKAVSDAFAACKDLPPDQSCDSIAQSKAEVRPAAARRQGLRSLDTARSALLALQAIATATATAIAQTAGSVKGGPGCSGQAQAQAEATVGGQP
jgi:hypothetical protein